MAVYWLVCYWRSYVCFVYRPRYFCFCKQKTAYEIRISDWSSDVCSSVLLDRQRHTGRLRVLSERTDRIAHPFAGTDEVAVAFGKAAGDEHEHGGRTRSEERRVGNGGVSKCRSRWAPCHYKQQPKR